MNLDEIEARANAATPGPWRDRHQVCSEVWGQAPDSQTCSMQIARAGHAQFDVFNAAFIASARTDVPALIARVRELEAERDAYARSHAILRAIHGALTDALPSTPIPALDSFGVVELVRELATECAALRREIAELMDDH